MKKANKWILFCSIFIFYAFSVQAQEEGNYLVYQYLKIDPTMESDYLELEIDIWKKIHKARIDQDLLDGWYLYRLISPNGSRTEYNFLLVLEYGNASKLSGHFESFGVDYTSVLSSEEIATALKTPEIRNQVYEEVWQTANKVSSKAGDDMFRFQVFNPMKLAPNKTAEDYVDVETKYWKPVHQQRILSGSLHSWGLYHMIIPGGTAREFEWATVDYYHEFIEILADNNPLLAKIHGKNKVDDIIEETEEARDLLRTEVRELIDYMIDEE